MEQFSPSLVEVSGGVIIAHCVGDDIELLKVDARLEVLVGIGQ
jgi:hypothetical protein